jgi:lysozyme family protein
VTIPTLDIADITLADAKSIYQQGYWTPARCDQLPWPLAYFVFDAAVNQGWQNAVKLLQKSVGTAQDGVIGNNTLVAIKRADQKELCALFMADRALRYTGTRNFDVYGRGWLKRLFVVAMEA